MAGGGSPERLPHRSRRDTGHRVHDPRDPLAAGDGRRHRADGGRTASRDHRRDRDRRRPAPVRGDLRRHRQLRARRRSPGGPDRGAARARGRDGTAACTRSSSRTTSRRSAGASSASAPTGSSFARWAGARRCRCPDDADRARERGRPLRAGDRGPRSRSTAPACRCSTTARRGASGASSRRSPAAAPGRERRSRPRTAARCGSSTPRAATCGRSTALTGALLLEFGYDAAGRLVRAEDGDGRKTLRRARRSGRADGDRRAGRAAHDARRERRRQALSDHRPDGRDPRAHLRRRRPARQPARSPRAAASSYKYDDDGRLDQRDRRRRADPRSWTRTEPLRRATTRGRDHRRGAGSPATPSSRPIGGGMRRTVRTPSGAVTELLVAPDGTRTLTLPSGETQRTTTTSDKRFGAARAPRTQPDRRRRRRARA